MDLFSLPRIKVAPLAPVRAAGSRSAEQDRPAWAQPQTSWPFRVIDPRSHRIGGEGVAQQSWAA